MEGLLTGSWNLILFLIELTIILLLIDAIMHILGGIFGFSWKKVLLWAAAFFGILWLKDFIVSRKNKTNTEEVQDLTEEDFEIVEE